MKLSELKPCRACGGPIAPIFAVVTIERRLIKPDAVNQTLGLAQMFRGSLALAEVMSPADDVTERLDERERVLCQTCMLERFGDIFDEEE